MSNTLWRNKEFWCDFWMGLALTLIVSLFFDEVILPLCKEE